ncbi:MAG: adenosylhomocysteinase [Armatimonadota bacterium]|nr:MAG: adenosylhomocysteinase [Armatimonadota bacterium]
MSYDVKDVNLAEAGGLRIEYAGQHMPVLRGLKERFAKEKPLSGIRMGACLHVTTETANLMQVLKAGGAEVALCGSNPLSTQNDVAAWLASDLGVPTFAVRGEDNERYYQHIEAVIAAKPQITMDDGCDLVFTIHDKHQEALPDMLGGSEETTTGVIRLRAMEKMGALRYPVIAVNDADTKHFFDNRYGTGQSTIDGIVRATNILLAGCRFVVCGYGWCGRGVAMRARGMGAVVAICEVDPVRALEAAMDGYLVMPIMEAARWGEVFVTLTGDYSVLRREHFEVMKDGAVLCNSGHFDVEIDIPALREMARSERRVRPMADEFLLPDGRRLYLLGEGRLVNLAAAEGHPASVMDMSFANQALCAIYLAKNGRALENRVHPVPPEIDAEVARLKLAAMEIEIDTLTPEQERYLADYQAGT